MAPITNYGGHATADQALDEVVRRLVEALDPLAIYLFGSRARGTARPDSDFDLMVITRPEDREAGYAMRALTLRSSAAGSPATCCRSPRRTSWKTRTIPPACASKPPITERRFMSADRRVAAFLTLADEELNAAKMLAGGAPRHGAQSRAHGGGIAGRTSAPVGRLPPLPNVATINADIADVEAFIAEVRVFLGRNP